MRLIWLRSEEKYDSIAAAMVEYFSDIIQPNRPCLAVRLKQLLAALKHSTLEPVSFSCFALRNKLFSMPQTIKIFANRA